MATEHGSTEQVEYFIFIVFAHLNPYVLHRIQATRDIVCVITFCTSDNE